MYPCNTFLHFSPDFFPLYRIFVHSYRIFLQTYFEYARPLLIVLWPVCSYGPLKLSFSEIGGENPTCRPWNHTCKIYRIFLYSNIIFLYVIAITWRMSPWCCSSHLRWASTTSGWPGRARFGRGSLQNVENTLAGERQLFPPKWRWARPRRRQGSCDQCGGRGHVGCGRGWLRGAATRYCFPLEVLDPRLRGTCACDNDGSGRWGLGALAAGWLLGLHWRRDVPCPVPQATMISLYISKCAAPE